MASRWWIASTLSFVLFATGCGGDQESPGTEAGAGVPVQQVAPAQTTPAPADPQAAPAATANPQPVPGAVLASTDSEVSGVTLAVTQLKRDRGDTVTLRFTITNGSSDKLEMYSNWLGDTNISSDYRAVGGVHLIDPVNNQKYFVVRDSERTCVCSRDVPDVEPGKSVNLWAKFPAPPAGVDAVSVVVPHFIPMDDVPVQN